MSGYLVKDLFGRIMKSYQNKKTKRKATFWNNYPGYFWKGEGDMVRPGGNQPKLQPIIKDIPNLDVISLIKKGCYLYIGSVNRLDYYVFFSIKQHALYIMIRPASEVLKANSKKD